jgi:hypothetical protein
VQSRSIAAPGGDVDRPDRRRQMAEAEVVAVVDLDGQALDALLAVEPVTALRISKECGAARGQAARHG